MELLFGCAYYPEYMPYERVETDIDMMKKAGMNTIRIAESTWSTLEPEPGRYDFSCIDKVLETAGRMHMKVIIGTPTYALPSWLAKMEPDVMVETAERRARYGRRQLVNIMNPVFRHYAERMMRALLSHTAGWECVTGFQVDNETKHYGNAGEEVQHLFVEYLKEKFNTPEKLNRAFNLAFWSNSIQSFNDFPDMAGCINGGLASEFEKFRRMLVAEYLSWQAGIVKEYKREDQFITHNLDFEWKKFGAEIAQDGYSYGVQPDNQHYEIAKCLNLAGADIYHPTQDELTGAEIAFCGDEIRCLKDRGYLVLECQAQAFKYWTPYPGQLKLHAYSHLASGAVGLSYWNWHSIHNGYETYWRGLLGHDLEVNPAYEEVCQIGAEWKKVGSKLLSARKDNKTALVIDNHSLTAFQWFPIDKELSYNDVVRWMYDSLYEMNIECDVVDVNALDVTRYAMIVTPALYSAKEETITALRDFVRSGGVLISSFRSFVADEYLTVRHDRLPHGLTECFGMSYNQFTEPGKTLIAGKPVQYFAELLKVENGESIADYEHKYWGKYSGITHNSYGAGHAYYIGCYTEKETLKKLYRRAVHDAGIESPEMKLLWPVIIRSSEKEDGQKKSRLHYVLHYSEDERIIECPYEKAENILDGKVYKKGEQILLKDWDVKLLEEVLP